MYTGCPTVLACGAWLKNAACLLDADTLVWSALHGDLGSPDACRALDDSARRLLGQARQPVVAVAHDLHPDFFSTRLAVALAHELQVPAIGVQHHYAHIAAVMAEHDVQEPVVGLALDGVGLGTDGKPWGGELLWVSLEGWKRVGHLWPLGLPGGDVAAREPWRMAASAMHALGRTEEIGGRFPDVAGATAARLVERMLTSGLNCPATSSAGRWFDAAAAALGLSVRQQHEAEAAMALERLAHQWLLENDAPTDTNEVDTSRLDMLDIRPLLARLLDSPRHADSVPAAAAWYHVALADALADWAALAAAQAETRIACLGGGCFYNAVLTRRVTRRLQHHGLRVLLPQAHSCGDAGLALGQAWAAGHQVRAGVPLPHHESQKNQTHHTTESLPCA